MWYPPISKSQSKNVTIHPIFLIIAMDRVTMLVIFLILFVFLFVLFLLINHSILLIVVFILPKYNKYHLCTRKNWINISEEIIRYIRFSLNWSFFVLNFSLLSWLFRNVTLAIKMQTINPFWSDFNVITCNTASRWPSLDSWHYGRGYFPETSHRETLWTPFELVTLGFQLSVYMGAEIHDNRDPSINSTNAGQRVPL